MQQSNSAFEQILTTQSSKKRKLNEVDTSPLFLKFFQPSNSLSQQVHAFDLSSSSYKRSSSPRLVDALQNVLYNQANSRASLDNLEAEEKCQFHPKDQHIAICEQTGVFACNKCVFEKKITKPLFMASFARQTKRKFDEMYNNLLYSVTCIEDLTPSLISTRIQTGISEFFNAIQLQLKEIEKDVIQQVKSSQTLKDLAEIIKSLNQQFDDQLLEKLESEKLILEQKVDQARFGFVVSRKQYYQQLIKEMEALNLNLTQKVESSSKFYNDLLTINCEKKFIYEKLYDIVDSSIKINNQNLNRKVPLFQDGIISNEYPLFQKAKTMEEEKKIDRSAFKTPSRQPEGNQNQLKNVNFDLQGDVEMDQSGKKALNGKDQNKEKELEQERQKEKENEVQKQKQMEKHKQVIEEEKQQLIDSEQLMENFYHLKEQKIIEYNLENKERKELGQIEKHVLGPKLAYNQEGRVFLIGGQKSLSSNEMLKDNLEVLCGKGGQMELVEKSKMKVGRAGFGCTIDSEGTCIYVVGGSTDKKVTTGQAEYYNIDQDKWYDLPSLPEPRLSSSLCLLSDNQLFSFGGHDSIHKLSTKIFQLSLKLTPQKWKPLQVALPHPMSSPGVMQISETELLIFGGFENEALKGVYTFRSHGPQKFLIEENKIQMKQGDMFLFTGAVRIDEKKGVQLMSGQNFIHQYNLKTKEIEAVKKLD